MSGTRNSSLLGKITILFVICCCCLSAQGKYGGGKGEPNDPYLIYDANHMQAIGADPNYWDAHFKMVNDINLADYTGTEFNVIGNDSNPFTGVFDGNSHTICNFTYESNEVDYIGLFGYVKGSDAEIKKLCLIDCNIDVRRGDCVGALVGYFGGGTIYGCYAKEVSVRGGDCVGGLVGVNNAYDFENPPIYETTILECYSKSTVVGENSVGGLVGRSIATGGPGCGNWNANILRSFSTGNVSGLVNYVGGLVGNLDGGNVLNCYSSSLVSGGNCAGGLTGFHQLGCISSCYSIGYVSGTQTGGLVGCANLGNTYNSFYDYEASGQDPIPPGFSWGTSKSTVEMKQIATFTNWDFVETWGIEDNQTYPFLKLTYPVGDLDYDKKVDFIDLAILANHWLAGVK